MALNLVQGKQIATASWAVNALTASYLEGYISPFPFTGSATISGSLVVTGSITATQGISGSFSGSGADLFNIPSSGIVGLDLSRIATGSVTASVSLGPKAFNVNSASIDLLTVQTDGKVGIGNSTPTSTLDVSSTEPGNRAVRIRHLSNATGSNGVIISTAEIGSNTNVLNLLGGAQSVLFVRSDGLVGIGTTSPQYKLSLATSTVPTGGIGFGNDVQLYRSATGVLTLGAGNTLNLLTGSLQVSNTTVIDNTRRIIAVDGNSGTPAFRFSSDSDTGMYRIGNNILGFATNGQERVRIGSTGNLGVTNSGGFGLLVPSARLHTVGTGNTSSTTNLLIQNSSLTNLLTVRDDGSTTLSGSLKFDPTQDPDPSGLDLDSTVLFQSSSNTALGYDLYIRQNGNLVKWKWVEGILETGLLYGGVVSYSGSNVIVSPGSGIIVDHNASTGSEVGPIVTYVTWNEITQSVTNIATQQVTYLYIDNNGDLQQQSSRFTSQQYHEYIPLGAVGHFDYTQISAFGGQVQTAYDQISQISNFVDAFGPLKISGYGITGQAASLRLSVGSGISFIHGGFYENDPEYPSQITTPAQATSSFAYVYRSGSGVQFDTNGGNFYTSLRPGFYDDGTGITGSVSNNDWTIQRLFSDPKTGVLYIYYGQTIYPDYLTAVGGLATDPFTEGDTFDFTTFIGFVIVKSNTSDITDTIDNKIVPAGLFRGSGQGSGGGVALSNLDDLTDVTITSPSDGQALIYDAGLWKNGTPISASYAQTASFAQSGNGPFSGSFSGSGANLFDIPASGITGLNLSQIATGSVTASVSPGTGSFEIVSGSTSLMFISSSGNVGITQNIPKSKLHITSNSLGSVTLPDSSGIFLENSTLSTAGTYQNSPPIVFSSHGWGQTTFDRLVNWRIYSKPVNGTLSEVTPRLNFDFSIAGGAYQDTGLYLERDRFGSYTLYSPGIVTGLISGLSALSIAKTNGGNPTETLTIGGASYFLTSGTNNGVLVSLGSAPTSGTHSYNGFSFTGTINQTGGASGVTRGLYVNPTITAAADFRAIETVAGNNLLNSTSGNTYVGLSTNTGTARLQVRGTGATSATNTLLLQNSSLTNLLTVRDDGSSTLIGRLNITPTTSTTSSLVVTGPTLLSGSFNTISGSVLTVVGSGSAQPVFTVQGSQGELFSVTDSLSGSLFSVNDISGLPIMEVFSDGTTLIGNYLDPMLITTTKNTLTNSGSFTIYSLPTASYDTAFFDYSIKSGSNARAGQIMAIQSASAVNYTETTTMDFGSTSGVSLGVFVSGSNMVLTGSADTTAWVIKTIVRSL